MQNFYIHLYYSYCNITFVPFLHTSVCIVSFRLLVDIVDVKSKNKEIVIFTTKSISPKCQHSFVKTSSQKNKGKCVGVKFFHFVFLLLVIQNLKYIFFFSSVLTQGESLCIKCSFIWKKQTVKYSNSSDHSQNPYYLPLISLTLYFIFTTILYISTSMSSPKQKRKPSSKEVK